MFCPNCASVIPDHSTFCPICGAKIEVNNIQVTEEPTAEQHDRQYHPPRETYVEQPLELQKSAAEPAPEKKSVDWSAFYQNYFYTLYVLIGVGAVVCNLLADGFSYISTFFFVVFTIFEYPLMFAFLALGIVRLVVGIKTRSKQVNPTKERALDIMIFGVSVIIFVYLFFATIFTFV